MSKDVLNALLVYLLMLLANPVVAQQRTQFWGLTAGFSPLQIKDQFHSDYTYRGTGLGLQAYYGHNRLKTQWQLEAAYTRATPQSIVSRKASTQFVDLTFDYQWRLLPVSRLDNRVQYFGGLGLRLTNNTTNYSPDMEVSTIVSTAVASLGVSAKATYQLSARQRIQGQAFASIVSAVYRPDYPYFGRDQVAISWLGKGPLLDAQVTYQYQFHERYQAVGFYKLTYFQYDQPRPLVGLRQQVGIGIQRTF
ncbi:hypothetical protein G8759_19045 [Spirosoma aureum]|uniref:Outer membrane protein beta-barrel domain-containing protein n=1 Tax=Spirosoma aureum TaxID=2692134 RepID=A0A6G9AQB1_9BACT|nr:outer membrane beta-barrel protein [Spirosoma aureum]QIP14558.1 hypothetical protein G8759_19045 [Spirosoma aureum]